MLKRKSVDLLLHKPRLRFRWHRWVAPAPPRIVTPTNVLGEPRGASLKNAPCADALGFDTRHRAFGHHDIMNCNHANSNFAIIICLHSFLNLLFDFSFLYLSYLLFFWCHEKKGTFFSMSNQISFYKVLSKWFHSKNGDGFNLTLSDSNSWPKKNDLWWFSVRFCLSNDSLGLFEVLFPLDDLYRPRWYEIISSVQIRQFTALNDVLDAIYATVLSFTRDSTHTCSGIQKYLSTVSHIWRY